jgi:Domain of unknown function (DUF1902)
MRTFNVHAHWDDDARVWWAESDEVPGLATEAPDLDQLHENVRMIAPDLLRENKGFTQRFSINLIKD